jgi:hypothetical protein
MKLTRPFLAAAALLASASLSQAAIVVTINARTLADELGTALPAGTLVQLVNLGANGVFDQIHLADDITGLNKWVSGDDSVINVVFTNGDGVNDPNGFTNTSNFDLVHGDDTIAGRLSREFKVAFDAVPANTKVGIRWFPDLQASNFNSLSLDAGQWYGEFTRQGTLQDPLLYPELNTTAWVWPDDPNGELSPVVLFDPLRTTDLPGGEDPVTSGYATHQVLVPEPAALSLALLSAVGLLGFRRRRL